MVTVRVKGGSRMDRKPALRGLLKKEGKRPGRISSKQSKGKEHERNSSEKEVSYETHENARDGVGYRWCWVG
ncbi:MAG: hypothetical protein HYZ72_15690 [Deltaproteobacteria bacterium]|nr:hypothetical protein [Deltaproteobacteria bacterium]